MYFSNQSKKDAASKKQNNICPKCGFDNHPPALYCEICFYPLGAAKYQPQKYPPQKHQPPKSVPVVPPLNLVQEQPEDNLQQELRKLSVISGLLVLGLAIALWLNYLLARQAKYLSLNGEAQIALYDSMSQVKDVPSGLFSYGGALYFSSLVTHGMNDAIAKDHPDFHLRYTKPANQDQSYTYGIKMLLDGELSFVFNGRPLTDREYLQAELRNIKLLQIPIAIDGIAVFGNNRLAVNNLSLEQVQAIFTGKITNWQQLGGADLPITPVLLTPENLEILAVKDLNSIPKSLQYVPNYTQAVRKVVAIPGAIAFASTSLIQNQQEIKVFNLAAEDSTDYVAPMLDKQPNLKLFENGTYPLTRRLFVVVRQDGTPDQLAGKAYAQMLLSHQGQSIVEAAGFVPLYNRKI
jgi:phosphate transport system substrate-binding protein